LQSPGSRSYQNEPKREETQENAHCTPVHAEKLIPTEELPIGVFCSSFVGMKQSAIVVYTNRIYCTWTTKLSTVEATEVVKETSCMHARMQGAMDGFTTGGHECVFFSLFRSLYVPFALISFF